MKGPDLAERKRVGVALGGGAARGPAHIGVLTVLERANIPIDFVAGTSAGVSLQQMAEIAEQIGWRNFARPTWPVKGLVSFAELERWLVALLGDLDFADLPVRFAAVAADLDADRLVTLRDGRVAPAVRASCSVPGIVAPVRMNGRRLVDGGVLDNLPVAAVRSMGADYVVAVDICRSQYRRKERFFQLRTGALETLVRRAGCGLAGADCVISPELSGFSYIRIGKQ